MKRKICVVTGARADYGLLYWLMREILADALLELQVVATGMHLSPEFGLTAQVIEADGFRIDARVESLLSSDTATAVAKSIGLGVIGFADALERLEPDIVVVLGDRFEIFAAAQAAMVARIPLAHIHGGEVTLGAIDEAMRHAVTKMAHIHFVACEAYRRRVIQLGEAPERVLNVGAPGLDYLQRLEMLDRSAFEQSIAFELGEPTFLVTYHSPTLGEHGAAESLQEMLQALNHFPAAKLIFTKSNADTGGRLINSLIEQYVEDRPHRATVFESLGQQRYLSALHHVDVVIGNSSSGIIEAPAVPTATVNIGDRQEGRLRASSIIDCSEDEDAIVASIKRALSPAFRESLDSSSSLYGTGNASVRMKEHLKQVSLELLSQKRFFDLSATVFDSAT